MAGIVKVVNVELKPEEPFKILFVDYFTLSFKALAWS